MEPKATPEKDDKIRESRHRRSSGEEEDPHEAQRRSKRSKLQTRHPSSPHRRIRDYRQEEIHPEHGDCGTMSRRHHHRYEDDSYQHDYYSGKSPYHDRSSQRRHDERSSPHRRIRDYQQEIHPEHGDHDAMSRRRHHRYEDDSCQRDYYSGKSPYHDRSSQRRHDVDERSSQRYHDKRSIRRQHGDSPPFDSPGDPGDRTVRRLDMDRGHDGGEHDPQAGQDVSEAPLSAAEKPSKCLMLDNLFDKYVVKPFDDSFKIDSVLLADVRADVHELCATKGGTVEKIHVDPYAGSVYVCFRDKTFAAAAKKALDGKYYNETRLITATYIYSEDHRMRFVV